MKWWGKSVCAEKSLCEVKQSFCFFCIFILVSWTKCWRKQFSSGCFFQRVIWASTQRRKQREKDVDSSAASSLVVLPPHTYTQTAFIHTTHTRDPHSCTRTHKHISEHPISRSYSWISAGNHSSIVILGFFFSFPFPPSVGFVRGRVAMSKREARSRSLCQDAPERTHGENKWWWNKKPTSPLRSEGGNCITKW